MKHRQLTVMAKIVSLSTSTVTKLSKLQEKRTPSPWLWSQHDIEHENRSVKFSVTKLMQRFWTFYILVVVQWWAKI